MLSEFISVGAAGEASHGGVMEPLLFSAIDREAAVSVEWDGTFSVGCRIQLAGDFRPR